MRPCLKVDTDGAQWGEASFSNCVSNEVQEIHNEVRRKAINNNDDFVPLSTKCCYQRGPAR